MKRLLTILLAGLLMLTVAGCEKKDKERQAVQQRQQQEDRKKDDFEAMPSPEGGGIVFDSGLD